MREFKRLLICISFSTRFPVNIGYVETEEMSASSFYYGTVGLIIGLFEYTIYFIMHLLFPKDVSILSAMFFVQLFTSFMNLDGLTDTCDGILSGRSNREKIFEIMKDSRIGVVGTAVVVFTILFKYKFYSVFSENFNEKVILIAFILVEMLSKASVYPSFLASHPAHSGSRLGSLFLGKMSKKRFIFAFFITIMVSFLVGKFLGIALCFAAFLYGFIAMKLFERQLGGMTGDVLGFIVETSQCILLSLMYILILYNRVIL